jgi:hypothetical protein
VELLRDLDGAFATDSFFRYGALALSYSRSRALSQDWTSDSFDRSCRGFPDAEIPRRRNYISLNGLYDAACVLLLFPLIILSGAHSEAGAGMMRLCKFSGKVSYPLYITHIPFVRDFELCS